MQAWLSFPFERLSRFKRTGLRPALDRALRGVWSATWVPPALTLLLSVSELALEAALPGSSASQAATVLAHGLAGCFAASAEAFVLGALGLGTIGLPLVFLATWAGLDQPLLVIAGVELGSLWALTGPLAAACPDAPMWALVVDATVVTAFFQVHAHRSDTPAVPRAVRSGLERQPL